MTDQLMLEYIFFHQEPCDRFKQFLTDKGVELLQEGLDETDVQGLVVCIADDLAEPLSDEIEDYYDQMMELNEALVIQDEGDGEMSSVGLSVSLADGRSVLASVDPDVLNRVLTVITHDELGKLVDVIADAVENPDQRPLCKR